MTGLSRITDFLELAAGDTSSTVAGVSSRSIGKGRASLGPEREARLEELVGSQPRETRLWVIVAG